MEALNKQTLIDFSPLSITPKQKDDDDWDEQQAEHRKDMYNIRLAIEDSGIELVLMSDRLVQNEALQMLAARSDTLANRPGQIAERRGSLRTMTTTAIAAGLFRRSLKSFDQYCKESGLPSIRELSDQELDRATRFIDTLFVLGDIIAPSPWSDHCRIKSASSSLSSSLSSSNFMSHWLSGIRPLKDSLIFPSKAKLLMSNSWTG